MAISVKKIALWRGKIENRPGTLARVLEPAAAARTDLQVVMGYREPGESQEAVIEVYPVSGARLTKAMKGAGVSPSSIPSLLVSGDNRPGLGHAMARALADAGVNIAFLVAQTVGRKYSAVFGFESEDDAGRAVPLLKKAAARPASRRA
jgi:hypothetical protein